MEKTIKIKVGEKKLDFMRAEGIVCDSCTYKDRCDTIKSPLNSEKTFQEFCCELDYKSPDIIPVCGTIEYNFNELFIISEKVKTNNNNTATKFRSLISTDAVYNQLMKWISRAKELKKTELELDANPVIPGVFIVVGKDDTDTKVSLRIDMAVNMRLKCYGYEYIYSDRKLKIIW